MKNLGLLFIVFFYACQQEAEKKGAASTPTVKIVTAAPNTNVIPPVNNPAGIPVIRPAGPPVTIPAGFYAKTTKYNTEQGLALSSILCSFADKSGNIWFGTNGGGVSRYDGKSFTTFTTVQGLANNTVLSMLEDKKGDLWFGTYGGGVSHYDGRAFINYTADNGLADNAIRCIIEDKYGYLWFATDGGGVSRFDGKTFNTYTTADGLAHNVVRTVVEDKKGELWFGTYGGGVSRFDGKTFATYSTANGLANNMVMSIVEDKKGRLWFGTNGGGVSCFDGRTFTTYTTANGLANNIVRCITEDKKGRLWLGTLGGGASCYDPKAESTKAFSNFTAANGISSDFVLSITEDKNGNIWMSTSDGVSRYDGRSFITYSEAQGLANSVVRSISQDKDGGLWFGTDGSGVSYFDGKTFSNYSTKQGLSNDFVIAMLKDTKGNIWFGTNGGGVSYFDGKNFVNYTTKEGLADNTILCIAEDRAGNIWFGTNGNGATRFDGKAFTNFTIAHGLADNFVLSITADKAGYLWFGTNGGGVSRFDGKYFTTYTSEQGLAGNFVLSITQDKAGNFWFGTDGSGVSRFDGKTFANYTIAQGLADDVVYDVVEDKQGIIWIGTNLGFSGLSYISKKDASRSPVKEFISGTNPLSNEELSKDYEPFFQIYNYKNGYPVKDVNTNAMILDKEGVIWAGTGDKLVRFDHNEIQKNTTPPHVFIQNIKVNNEKICWNDLESSKFKGQSSGLGGPKALLSGQGAVPPNVFEEVGLFGKPLNEAQLDTMIKKFGDVQFSGISRFYPLPENLVLPFVHNNISFDFAAVEPAQPYMVRYQYVLEGYDMDWNPVTDKTTATFGNIHEGIYTFKVKAQNPDGVWSKPISYTFSVLPPWYRTWWAYVLYLIIGTATLLLLFRWRTASLRKDKERLEQTVKERTAEVEKQKEVIEKKNLNITQSINYAKHIQDALLQSEEKIRQHLPQLFVYNRPKDIVSGDFCWFSQVGEKIIISVADCTGHGVPGAFMSVIGNSLLNEIVNKYQVTDPGKILQELHQGILKLLQEKQNGQYVEDGMDISVCMIDSAKGILKFAGAKNPLYVLKDGLLEVLKATPYSIGGKPFMSSEKHIEFATHSIPIEVGMNIYMFSDGYIDQFGGPNRRKFGSGHFKDVLRSMEKATADAQKANLRTIFEEWMEGQTQVDDVLVMGLKF